MLSCSYGQYRTAQSGTGESWHLKRLTDNVLMCSTGVLADNAEGKSATETIYDDSNPEQIESLPDTQLHRNVDLEILRADKEGRLARTFVKGIR